MTNPLEKHVLDAPDIGAFATRYFDRLKSILDSIERKSIMNFAKEFESARENGSTIFLAGNGGSATTATSMANDLGFDVVRKAGTDKPFKILALTDNVASITAIGNDVGYEHVFINQLKLHYRKGDKIVVISASGNSPNVVSAAQYVKDNGGTVIGMLGFTGGALAKICDVVVHVPSEPGEYGPVEDAHLIINHVLAHWFQVKLRSR